MVVLMTTIHTEPMLSKLTKPELVEIVLKTQINRANRIDLMAEGNSTLGAGLQKS